MNDIILIVWKTLAVTFAAVLAQVLIGALVYQVVGPVGEDWPGFSETILPLLAGTLLTVIVLICPTVWSRLSGVRLFLALFLLVFGLNVFLTNIEGAIFLNRSPLQVWSGIVNGTLRASVLALLMVMAFGGGSTPDSAGALQRRFTTGQLAGRFTLAAFVYLTLYIVAGLLILPHIQAFYDMQEMNLGPWFFPFQLLRGTLYVLFAWYLVRNIEAPRWRTALAAAIMFPIIAGVADLLTPMPFMPDHVRHWHILEIGWSNFVYGLLVGYLFWNGGIRSEPGVRVGYSGA